MAVKIISGLYRGRKLKTPEATSENSPVRPTKARVREAGFNMLFSRIDFNNSTCLDLFSGSGAAGIEAISRGAKHVTFVDTDSKWIEENLNICKINSENYKVMRANALNINISENIDIIFVDPPYKQDLAQEVLKNKEKYGKQGTLWLIEVESYLKLEVEKYGFELLKNKKYGKSTLYLAKQL